MTQANTRRGSFTIGLMIASGVSAGCGSNAGADSAASAGAAGAISAAGSAGASGGAASSTAGTNAMGGASASSAGSAAGGASAGATSGGSGGTLGTSGAAAGGNAGAAHGGNAGAASGGGAGSGGSAGVDCKTKDPLKTNNGKWDAYDCAIIDVANKWGMPDPMIVKSQVQQESNFSIFAISGDSPCGIMQGWTDAESKSFGLIQTTPACGEAKSALLPNGHPNLTQDMSSALWANSVFNPPINLDEGVKTDSDSLTTLKKKYPTCSAAQYNMMAAGAFNSGNGAILGCANYNTRAQMYVTAITSHYHQFATASGWPDPY